MTRILWLAVLFILLASPAIAQTIPGPAEPSRVQKQIQPLPTRKGVEMSSPAPATEAAEAPEGADKITFVFETVAVEGMTVYAPRDIVPLYLDMVGRTVSFADVYKLAEKLTARYRNDGYILSQVYVPPQTVDNGHVVLQAVEGFVDEVVIQSDREKDTVDLKPYADKITAPRPLKAARLEKTILLLNDLPGVSAKSVLSPSPAAPGASTLTLVITHKKYDVSFAADNRGSRYVGPLQLNTGLRLNNFLGLRESINVQLATAPEGHPHREMDFGSVGLTQPIGHQGTTVNLNASVAPTEPGFRLTPFGIQGISHTYTVDVTHPFIRSRDKNLFGSLKFMYLDTSRIDNLGLGKTEDRLRVARLGGTFQATDGWNGSNTVTAEISKGLDIFGIRPQGSPNMTRAGGDPKFFKATAEVSRLQNVFRTVDLFGSVTGQWSNDVLLASEEFGVGGTTYGSAYNSSEITGQKGLAGRLELRDNNPFAIWLQAWQIYGFYDLGQVWDPQNATVKDRIRSIASTGTGIRAMINDMISCSVELAVPLTRPVESQNSNDPRLFAAVSAKF